MVITLIRAVILYGVVILALRLMGKRQIGELQPEELVITILISECAAAPIQDLNRPVINGIIAIFTLVILEILFSFLSLKLPVLRNMFDGKPAIVIRDGVIQQKTMAKLRLTVEDLLSSLRQKGYFKLEDISYCIVETDGKLSVLPTPQTATATAQMVCKVEPDNGLPCVVIGDGTLHHAALALCHMTEKQINTILKKEKTALQDVFVMTADKSGNYTLIKKETIR
ncbi:MAG: DUF421 domain-containing protein [Clostridia bacterium]|nr:DUF421 domain-containing protein [Clostridia bacterium]